MILVCSGSGIPKKASICKIKVLNVKVFYGNLLGIKLFYRKQLHMDFYKNFPSIIEIRMKKLIFRHAGKA